VWYRRHVERFIRFLKPRRLREATSADVVGFLLRVHRQPDTEAWQVRQAAQALRLLYQEILDNAPAAERSVPRLWWRARWPKPCLQRSWGMRRCWRGGGRGGRHWSGW
jgi:hypothetical protein